MATQVSSHIAKNNSFLPKTILNNKGTPTKSGGITIVQAGLNLPMGNKKKNKIKAANPIKVAKSMNGFNIAYWEYKLTILSVKVIPKIASISELNRPIASFDLVKKGQRLQLQI
ncbi:hypothetical protein [Bacillus coahuilensis]|uniref:hypothetical protein n=1 Tax=Bacillus coahuilensis TaxID=408580 RepID=UPI0012ACE0B9|nr:hypothetical protein [Bacillus coahuilensis]